MLLATWFDEPHRATRYMDLLGFGDAAEDALVDTFREIMAVEVDDGVSFDLKGLRIEAIREELEYGGSRIRTTAALAGARIPITVDIGFGDAVEPGVQDIDLPVLLDMPSPHLRAYPPETVIAEKFHAMVALGRATRAAATCHRGDVFASQHGPPYNGPGRAQRRICSRCWETAAVGCLCSKPLRHDPWVRSRRARDAVETGTHPGMELNRRSRALFDTAGRNDISLLQTPVYPPHLPTQNIEIARDCGRRRGNALKAIYQ
jgi:hypothetical protein